MEQENKLRTCMTCDHLVLRPGTEILTGFVNGTEALRGFVLECTDHFTQFLDVPGDEDVVLLGIKCEDHTDG